VLEEGRGVKTCICGYAEVYLALILSVLSCAQLQW